MNSTDFVGRISTTVTLKELPLSDCAQFWHHSPSSSELISSFEKLKILSVTGGVPRYLEEINPLRIAEENIDDLCFRSEGFLYNEMEKIFNDSFDDTKEAYGEIVNALKNGHSSFSEIGTKVKISVGGTLTKYLSHLQQAGFITKDPMWRLDGRPTKTARYRICDNYLRFYLRCIEPNRAKIEQGIRNAVTLGRLPAWRGILGLQFENLVYNNLNSIIEALNIDPQHIVSIGPYMQRRTTKNAGACQIDLLIHSKFDSLYLCELKFRRTVEPSVIREVQERVNVLKRPKYLSVRPVLIYAGELSEDIQSSDYFYRHIDVGSLVK